MSSTPAAAERKKPLGPGGSRIIKGKKIETTLGEHGRGVLIGKGKDRQSYKFCPIDLPYRVMIAREVDNNIDLRNRLGEKLMRALALSLTKFGDEGEWKKKSLAVKLVVLGSTLTVGDIQYMAMVRLAEEYPSGWKRHMPFDKCPYCKSEALPIKVTVDLKKLYCVGWDSKPETEYMLEYPWWLHGMEVKTVTMTSPLLVTALQEMSDDDADDELTRNLLWMSSSILKINGSDRTIDWKDLKERDPTTGRGMHNEDFDRMVGIMNNMSGGPGAAVLWKHDVPTCGNDLPIPVAWGDAFFVRSGA